MSSEIHISDPEILKLIRDNPSEGLSVVLDTYGGSIKTICANILGRNSTQDIEECISDILTQLWQSAPRIDLTKGSLRSYLYGIARHKAVDRRRKNRADFAAVPAEEADLRVEDLITAVDGTDIRALSTAETRDLVRGKEGTQVVITLERDGVTLDKTVTRRKLETPVARGEMLSGNVGLVTIENFDARCAEETRQVVDSLLEQGAKALIFDVRNNPGGYANELVKVLDMLLPEGEVFRTVSYTGKEQVDYSDADCLGLPMAVLVNENSYSAAEFFAAALQEYDKAIIVGQQTVGKGYFQNTFRLSDGSAVGLSTGKYFTPQGRNLAGVGVTPDICVSVDDETGARIYYNRLTPEEDPQIQAALEAVVS